MLGFINVNKPSGLTSSNVVVKLRKTFHIDKIGHMGTLDPMASGVLPIAIGKATRMFDYFMDKYKTYCAVFEFGYATDTLDIDGNIVKNTDNIPTDTDVKEVLNQFVGKISQIPPNFSAKLVNGVRAYKLARNGQDFELKPKIVEILKYELISQKGNCFEFEITCSSGTYIRALARDLAKALNSLCTMVKLERVESGVFNIKNSYNLDDLLKMDSLESVIFEIEKVFPKIKTINVSIENFNKLKNGLTIKDVWNVDDIVFIKHENVLLGVAEKLENNLKLKTYLME